MATVAPQQYILPLAQGRESDPLPIEQLYELARTGQLQPYSKIFDVREKVWLRADSLPPLVAIFRQVIPGYTNEPRPNPNEIEIPPPLMRRVVLKLAHLFGKDEVL